MTELQTTESGRNYPPAREHFADAVSSSGVPGIQQAPGMQVSGGDVGQMYFDMDAATWREPLNRLPPGPWVSSGGYLNYEAWPDRARFLELDRAIALRALLAKQQCHTQQSIADLKFLVSTADFSPNAAVIPPQNEFRREAFRSHHAGRSDSPAS
jgi:hypothetical protein